MSKQKLTQWFPADVKPVHVGVYETDEGDFSGRCFAYWDGNKFCYRWWVNLSRCCAIESAVSSAFKDRFVFTGLPKLVGWRGLAVKP